MYVCVYYMYVCIHMHVIYMHVLQLDSKHLLQKYIVHANIYIYFFLHEIQHWFLFYISMLLS